MPPCYKDYKRRKYCNRFFKVSRESPFHKKSSIKVHKKI